MIKLAIVDDRFPEDTIHLIEPRDLAQAIYEVSKIRHTLSSDEFLDIAESSIKKYLNNFEPNYLGGKI